MVTIYIGLSLIPILFIVGYTYIKRTPFMQSYSSDFCKNLKNYNFQLIGRYDTYVYHSLRIWCYYLEVLFYRKSINDDIYNLLLDWNKTCNSDPTGILYEAIDKSHTMFLNIVDTARRENTVPAFGAPIDFNYHDYGKSLNHNDYVDMKTIIRYIDDIMEVHDGK